MTDSVKYETVNEYEERMKAAYYNLPQIITVVAQYDEFEKEFHINIVEYKETRLKKFVFEKPKPTKPKSKAAIKDRSKRSNITRY